MGRIPPRGKSPIAYLFRWRRILQHDPAAGSVVLPKAAKTVQIISKGLKGRCQLSPIQHYALTDLLRFFDIFARSSQSGASPGAFCTPSLLSALVHRAEPSQLSIALAISLYAALQHLFCAAFFTVALAQSARLKKGDGSTMINQQLLMESWIVNHGKFLLPLESSSLLRPSEIVRVMVPSTRFVELVSASPASRLLLCCQEESEPHRFFAMLRMMSAQLRGNCGHIEMRAALQLMVSLAKTTESRDDLLEDLSRNVLPQIPSLGDKNEREKMNIAHLSDEVDEKRSLALSSLSGNDLYVLFVTCDTLRDRPWARQIKFHIQTALLKPGVAGSLSFEQSCQMFVRLCEGEIDWTALSLFADKISYAGWGVEDIQCVFEVLESALEVLGDQGMRKHNRAARAALMRCATSLLCKVTDDYVRYVTPQRAKCLLALNQSLDQPTLAVRIKTLQQRAQLG